METCLLQFQFPSTNYPRACVCVRAADRSVSAWRYPSSHGFQFCSWLFQNCSEGVIVIALLLSSKFCWKLFELSGFIRPDRWHTMCLVYHTDDMRNSRQVLDRTGAGGWQWDMTSNIRQYKAAVNYQLYMKEPIDKNERIKTYLSIIS